MFSRLSSKAWIDCISLDGFQLRLALLTAIALYFLLPKVIEAPEILIQFLTATYVDRKPRQNWSGPSQRPSKRLSGSSSFSSTEHALRRRLNNSKSCFSEFCYSCSSADVSLSSKYVRFVKIFDQVINMTVDTFASFSTRHR